MKRKQRQQWTKCIWIACLYISFSPVCLIPFILHSRHIFFRNLCAAHSIDFSPSLFIRSGYKKNHVKIKRKPIACIYKTVEMFRHNFEFRCLLFVLRSTATAFHWIHFPLQVIFSFFSSVYGSISFYSPLNFDFPSAIDHSFFRTSPINDDAVCMLI